MKNDNNDALNTAVRSTVGLERKYIPKGGMCSTCIWLNADCSHLEFETMQAIGTTAKGEIIVRCTAHMRSN